MAQTDDPNGVIELASEAVGPLGEELRHRLAVDVDERDALAIETALLKAFVNGMSTGNSQALEGAIEQGRARSSSWGGENDGLQPPLVFPRVDPWAEKYGRG